MNKISVLTGTVKTLLGGDGLASRAARGGLWIGAGSTFEQALRFLRNIILTRLLAPEDFGLMAIVLAVNTFFESCTSIGVEEAVLQNPRSEEPSYLNGVFWMSVARAVCLYIIVFLSAPWIATFYDQPILPNLMRVAFLVILFNGAKSPQAFIAHKHMDFKRVVSINQGGGVIGALTAIVLSLYMRNVWAIAIGFVVESFARCVLSYNICPFRPRLSFEKESLQALVKFSRGAFGLHFLTFIFLRADVFVIGKVCSAAELGIYSMVSILAQIPYTFFATFISKILDPTFSEMQHDKERLNNTLLKMNSMIVLLTFPALLYVVLYARSLLTLLYGPVYASAAIPFGILFAVAVIRVFSSPVVSLYFMIGRPDLNRRYLFIRTAVMLTLIYPAVKWYGLNGAAFACFVALMFAIVLQMFGLRSITGLDFKRFNPDYVRIMWSLTPVLITYFVTTQIRIMPGPVYLGVGLLGCTTGYFLAFRSQISSLNRKIRHYQPEVPR